VLIPLIAVSRSETSLETNPAIRASSEAIVCSKPDPFVSKASTSPCALSAAL
jgi:hypothetical protein